MTLLCALFLLPWRFATKPVGLLRATKGGKKSFYGWSQRPIGNEEPAPERTIQRGFQNNQWSFIARFADDFIVLVNSQAAVDAAFAGKAAVEFLAPRGLELNIEKSFVRELPSSPFTFVGFTFHTAIAHGKAKVYNVIPRERFTAFISKLRNILNPTSSVELVFQKLNPVLNGWTNFYSVGNTSQQISIMSYRLWHLVYMYFFNKYKKFSRFKAGGQGVDRSKLSNFIWTTHHKQISLRFKTGRRTVKWWYLDKKDRRSKRARLNDLILYYPKQQQVSTPSIVVQRSPGEPSLGLSAFHPEDRTRLNGKALGWKKGLSARVIKKTDGCCALCRWNLLANQDEKFELHHQRPISFGGKFSFKNLLPLCQICHKEVSTAVQTKNLDLIQTYEKKGILTDVSLIISTLDSKISEPE